MVRCVVATLTLVLLLEAPAAAGLPLIPDADRSRQPVAAAAQADRAVIGRMGKAEPDPVKLEPAPGLKHQVTYAVYRLAVTETLAGGKAVTEVRVASPVSDPPRNAGRSPANIPTRSQRTPRGCTSSPCTTPASSTP